VTAFSPLWLSFWALLNQGMNRFLKASQGPAEIYKIIPPISNAKKSNQRWIEIDLSSQRLTAWQGKNPEYAVIISTGKNATPTLTGVFSIQTKLRSARMQGDDYDIPDVPYTMFYSGGYAIHGAYWHRSFGTPVSHGCVNVAVDHAERLFDWAEVGTPVIVRQ